MLNKFFLSVAQGNYEQAESFLKNIPDENLSDAIINFGYETENISVLGFLIYMSDKTHQEFWNDIMIVLLLNVFNDMEGAYSWAYHYAKENLKIERSNSNLEQLLFFFEIPEKLLPEEEAKCIANEILKTDSQNHIANRILKKINSTQKNYKNSKSD